ncbi:MAG: DNA-binding protein [Thermomicrobiales bacterium]
MYVAQFTTSRQFALRFDPGEDVLLALRAAVEREGIRNATILSGVGSLSAYHYHVVASTNLPPGNVFAQGEGGYDIVNVNGVVIDGRVHAHITFSDLQGAYGGHLEEGCIVLTFAVIVVAETADLSFAGWDTPGAFGRAAGAGS